MLALPLRLEGSQILDANGVSIALLRGEMPAYRDLGAEIIAAVNSHADLLKAAKAALLADDSEFQIWADLKAAIARAEQI